MNILRRTPVMAFVVAAVTLASTGALLADPPAKPDEATAKKKENDKPAAGASQAYSLRWHVAGADDAKKGAARADYTKKGGANMRLQVVPMLKSGGGKEANVRVLMFKSDEADTAKLQQLSKDGVIVVVIPDKASAGVVGGVAKVHVEKKADGDAKTEHHTTQHREIRIHRETKSAGKKDGDAKKEIHMRVEVVGDKDGKKEERRVIILSDGNGKDGTPHMQFIPKDGKVVQLLRILPEGRVEVEVEAKEGAKDNEHGSVPQDAVLRALSGRAVGEVQKKLMAQLKQTEAAQHHARARAEEMRKQALERAKAAQDRALSAAHRSAAGSAALEKRLDRIEEQLRDLRGMVRELVEEIEEHDGDDDDD